MSGVEVYKVSSSGQISLPARVRRRWALSDGGNVEVLDLGFGVLTLPVGGSADLLERILPADRHYERTAAEVDPDLIS